MQRGFKSEVQRFWVSGAELAGGGEGQCSCEDLQKRVPVVDGTGSAVEAVGDGVEFVLAEDAQFGALGQVPRCQGLCGTQE